jgi:hypothetical protein
VLQQQRAGAGAIFRRADETGGQQPLPLQPDAGIRQRRVFGALLIVQQMEQIDFVQRPRADGAGQGRPGAHHFRPRSVQQGVAQPVDAGPDRLAQAADVAVVPDPVAIGQQQIETGAGGDKALAEGLRRLPAADERRDQGAATGGVGRRRAAGVTVVGDQSKTVVVAQGHPATAGLQIAPPQNGLIWPGGEGGGGAGVKFIPVGDQQQRPLWVAVDGDTEQTHIPSGFICRRQSLL